MGKLKGHGAFGAPDVDLSNSVWIVFTENSSTGIHRLTALRGENPSRDSRLIKPLEIAGEFRAVKVLTPAFDIPGQIVHCVMGIGLQWGILPRGREAPPRDTTVGDDNLALLCNPNTTV